MSAIEAATQQIIDEVMSWRHRYLDEDTWYSCAQAVSPDEDEPGSGCSDDSRRGGPCDCGLFERQERILGPLAEVFGHRGATEVCGDFNGEEDWFSAECDLPRGHEGDHHAVVTWPKVEWVRSEPTPMSEAIQRIWAPTLERMLAPVTWPQLRDAARGSDE